MWFLLKYNNDIVSLNSNKVSEDSIVRTWEIYGFWSNLHWGGYYLIFPLPVWLKDHAKYKLTVNRATRSNPNSEPTEIILNQYSLTNISIEICTLDSSVAGTLASANITITKNT